MPDVSEVRKQRQEPEESSRYEKPAVQKIGNMSANTKQKTPVG